MAKTIQTAQQSQRPYTVVVYDWEWNVLRTWYPGDFDELITVVDREHHARVRTWSMHGYDGVVGHLKVFTYRGKPLVVEELVACAKRRQRQWYRGKQPTGYVHRNTPVPDIRRRRRYGRGLRRAAVMGELRMHASVMKEEGEMPCRKARLIPLEYHLDWWVEVPRHWERSWKYQHKGRKAWDKPRLAN